MRALFVIFICLLSGAYIQGQTRAELEDRRKKALEDIEYVDKLIRETEKERRESMSQVTMIGRKLTLRENIIKGIQDEVVLLEGRIELNTLVIELMEADLETLIEDYEKAIVNAQKVSKGQPEAAYILSSRDLNQGYKRMKYLQQVAKFRRREAEVITELKEEIDRNRDKLEEDLNEITLLKRREESQKSVLQKDQNSKRNLVNSLGRKQKELQQELEKKRRIAIEIEAEIERVVEEERRRRTLVELAPEEKIIGDDFERNRGKLPWPVDVGVITSQFGIHDHPVFKGTKVDNIGIENTSGQRVAARAIFKGKVMSVFGISGGNMAIIIRHGNYLSVYQNLINVVVKPGDEVEIKQKIGDVFVEEGEGGKCVIKLMIYLEKEKKNPEEWIAKKRE